jgi:hypothetical protein
MAIIQSLGNRMNAKTLGEWVDIVANHVSHMFSNHCSRVDIDLTGTRRKQSNQQLEVRGCGARRQSDETCTQEASPWGNGIDSFP